MLEDFLSYIETNLSVFPEDKLLLSVSGGVDSMVMLHLFSQLGYNISAAHINHSTRKGESDTDMSFVESECDAYSVPFFSKTLRYAKLSQGNFQDNARKERFLFLSQLQEKNGFKWIATAHHKDDKWETFLMNLNRKSGIQGLTSLRGKENKIIHPLLIFTKAEIKNYAKDHDIKYVNDSSNDSNDYLRNSIRNQITPIVTQIFPNFIVNANQSLIHLENDHQLLQELIDKSEFFREEASSGYIYIDLIKIKSFKAQAALLYHVIEKYGFNYSDALDILQSHKTGAIFQSTSFEALLNREKLIIRNKKERIKIEFLCNSPGNFELTNGIKLSVNISDAKQTPQWLWLNNDKVNWPLTIRNIEPGDKFKPDGMKGATKTIKKLCTDLKINRFVKDELLLVCENDKILQVIGIKTSHNYATTDIKNALTFSIVK